MKKIYSVTLLLGVLTFLFPTRPAKAYDTYVIHPRLSRAVAEAYNNSHTDQLLTSQQIEWLTAGSIREDEPATRALNHFFNPQTQQGLTIAGVRLGQPSPRWALSSALQAGEYPEGDCSWERALREQAAGNAAQSFMCLGQVLHLLEDASVPAHTRDDQHLTGDPYEQWLKFHNPPLPAKHPAVEPNCSRPEVCIAELARWTNENFVSEDTIRSSPLALPVTEARIEGTYLIRAGRRLAAYNPKRKRFWLPGEIQEAYWQEISPVMVAYGRRLVELFAYVASAAPEPLSASQPAAAASSVSVAPLEKAEQPAHTIISESEGTDTYLAAADRSELEASVPQLRYPAPSVAEAVTTPETYMTLRPASRTRERRADFMFASDDAGAIFKCDIDQAGWNACPAFWQLSDLAEGEYEIRVRAEHGSYIDQSPLAYRWTIDLTAPLSFLAADAPQDSRQATFRFFSEEGAVFQCRLDAGDWQECQSPQQYNELLAGPHAFHVRALDVVGNVEALPSAYLWTLRIDPPPAPEIIFPDAERLYTAQTKIQLRVRTCDTCRVVINGSEALGEPAGLDDAGKIQIWEVDYELTSGSNTITLRARNRYGEESAPRQLTIISDRIAPAARLHDLASSYLENGFVVEWEGDDDQGITSYEVEYRLNDDGWQFWTTGIEQDKMFNGDWRIGDAIAFRVRARDEAGNRGEWSAPMSTRRSAAPAQHLLISQVARTPAGAFVELYNPTERSIYLAGSALETSASAGILWSSLISGSFSSAALVPPHGYYLIASAGLSDAWPDAFLDATALPADSGHIRVRGADGAEIDRIGYGTAALPEGRAAPSLTQTQGLERKATVLSTAATIQLAEGNGLDSNDNHYDFFIQPQPHPRGSQNRSGNERLGDNLEYLWHFDECAGATRDSLNGLVLTEPSAWTVGRFGCGVAQSWNGATHIRWRFPKPLAVSEFTVSMYVQAPGNSSGIIWLLDGTGNFRAGFWPNPSNARVVHNGNYFALAKGVPAERWVLTTMVYSANYLAWYLDGELVQKIPGDFRVTNPLAEIMIAQESGPWLVDEVGIWSRALSSGEIAAQVSTQIIPHALRPLPENPQMVHHWSFDEETGAALDSAAGTVIPNVFRTEGWQGLAAYFNWRGEYKASVDIPALSAMDMSLSYWRRDGPLGGGGSGGIALGNKSLSGIAFGAAGGFEHSYMFHNSGYEELPPLIPHDDRWHHITVVYDSYAYQLRYYLDGQRQAVRPAIWLHLPFDYMAINETQGTFTVDELTIWRGALNDAEIEQLAGASPAP